MPTLSQEQLDEIECEMQDLLDEIHDLIEERNALKAEVLRLRQLLKTD
jgi:regulator of replication initiation timing